ncbi:hypothetical protein [Pedobacter gandavensis]|uniref:hypothetical protein n=1 Tax=Pedobacter gandavensis TaxID=2679963 RepID=UPI0029311DCA|nr:hypothetical protein [Pedobacter gandavensis]
MANNWYSYNGIGDPILPGSYFLMDLEPNCLGGGTIVCAIYLTGTSDVPGSIPASVKTYIANAQATLVAQPNGGARHFVYVKDL